MTSVEKLEALVKYAKNRDFRGPIPPSALTEKTKYTFIRSEGLVQVLNEGRLGQRWLFGIFNHDFARALFGDAKVPNEDEIDENHSKLGLYNAEGGGYEGYGDYVYLTFEGEPWQYHLQQAVLSDDPIGYMYGVVSGDNS
jgi:hypothetical protein